MFGSHVVMGRGWGTEVLSLRDICRRTTWKEEMGMEIGFWVKFFLQTFIVSNVVSHTILLHPCCDWPSGENVEFHNIRFPGV